LKYKLEYEKIGMRNLHYIYAQTTLNYKLEKWLFVMGGFGFNLGSEDVYPSITDHRFWPYLTLGAKGSYKRFTLQPFINIHQKPYVESHSDHYYKVSGITVSYRLSNNKEILK